MKDRGVVYAVTQSECYLEAALMSALALRSLEPDLPITIFSDHPSLRAISLQDSRIAICSLPSLPFRGSFASRWLKTHLGNLSAYQETLFLDADILPLQPIQPIWDYLNEADWAMALDRLPTVALCDHIALEEKRYTLAQLSVNPHRHPQYNSGVMLWRKTSATQLLFEQWYEEWQVFEKQDQLAFVRAAHRQKLPIALLPKTYNISPRDAMALMQAGESVHLLHCWGGQVMSGEFRRHIGHYHPQVISQLERIRGTAVKATLEFEVV